jgi:hypothetical protein
MSGESLASERLAKRLESATGSIIALHEVGSGTERLCALSRRDGIKSRKTLLDLRAVAMRAANFLLTGLSQGQDL